MHRDLFGSDKVLLNLYFNPTLLTHLDSFSLGSIAPKLSPKLNLNPDDAAAGLLLLEPAKSVY